MKAKKFIVLLIFTLLLLFLSSCEREGSDISIKEGGLPSVDYSEGVVAAVVNLDTKKIHTDVNCRYAEMINEDFRDLVPRSYLDYLTDSGYTYCKVCSKHLVNEE